MLIRKHKEINLIELIKQQKLKPKIFLWGLNSQRFSKEYVEKIRNGFKSLQSCLTGSSWIRLIHFIKRIWYKIRKTRTSLLQLCRFRVYCSGGSRLFLWGGCVNSQSGCASLLFCKFLAENWMKMKELGSRGGTRILGNPLGSANVLYSLQSSCCSSLLSLQSLIPSHSQDDAITRSVFAQEAWSGPGSKVFGRN